MLEDLKIPQKDCAWVKGCFEWDKQKQHELCHYGGFPPSKDTENRGGVQRLNHLFNPNIKLVTGLTLICYASIELP